MSTTCEKCGVFPCPGRNSHAVCTDNPKKLSNHPLIAPSRAGGELDPDSLPGEQEALFEQILFNLFRGTIRP